MQGFGEWIILSAVPAYLMISPDLGMTGVMINEIPKLKKQGSKENVIELFSSLVLFNCCIGLIVLMVVGILLFTFSIEKIFDLTHVDGKGSEIVILLLVNIFFVQIANTICVVFRAEERSVLYNIYYCLYQFMVVSASLLYFYLFDDFVGYASMLLGITVVYVFALLLWFYSVRVDYLDLSSQSFYRTLKPYFREGFGHASLPFLHAFQIQGVLILLGLSSGSSAVAIFQTTRVLTNSIKMLLGILGSPIMIEIPLWRARGDQASIVNNLIKLSKAGSLCYFLIFAFFVLFVDELYVLWLGDSAEFHSTIFFLLFLSLLPFVISYPSYIYLIATNSLSSIIFKVIIISIFFLVFSYFLSEVFGLNGLGFAVLLLELSLAVVFVLTAKLGIFLMFQKKR